ncbi:MAG: hypothetical protein GWN37_11470 [Gammaproteobacteria bacterium]|nr:hypothetical protein [Gammaproteobacteria bacterium]
MWVRIWHWSTAALFCLLLATGFALHFAAPGFSPVPFATARTMHDVAGVMLTVLYGLYVTVFLASGYWREYVPWRRGLWHRLNKRIVFYTVGTLRGDALPQDKTGGSRFNPLQQIVYLSVVAGLIPALVVTGVPYLFPDHLPAEVLGLDGLWPVALAHYALSVMGAMFLIVHVYMATLPEGTGVQAVLARAPRARSCAGGPGPPAGA